MCNGDYNLDCGIIIAFSSMNTFEYVVCMHLSCLTIRYIL